MAVDLSVDFCGVRFKNPFVLSPSPASLTEFLPKAAKAGWAGAVTWTAEVTCEPEEGGRHSRPQYWLPHGIEFIDKAPSFWSFHSTIGHRIPDVTYPCPPERIARVVEKAKAAGLPIIANVVGSTDVEKWVRSCVAAERAGADILEVNISYAIYPKGAMHRGFHRNLDLTRGVIKAIRENTRLPIMTKLNAFLIPQEVRDWAKACVEAGANAISITNSLPGVAGVDVETGAPLSTFIDVDGKVRGQVEIVTGPAIRPVGLAGVALVSSSVNVPIAAIGGISDWRSAVEYMMLGASIVEVGSAVLAYGHRMVRDLVRGLEQFMARKGYENVSQFIGITNKRYRVGEVFSEPAPARAQPRELRVDEDKCNGCGRCLAPCEISSAGAIAIVGGVAQIDQALCQKCNLCMLVCPEKAVSVQWRENLFR